ncbi:hypothetical protein N5853_14035 (plasmid) [Bartonella sp. HY329]|uniref:hypothetical protein n=1 Tax=unclassified Bartonella TaxID=2645622 RepID=UPI0021C592F9|nr:MULTISPECIES: hypothetical protein [unclassified Bartonella]UXM96649.1 hypothetical protein N5853_14035 [Bartonella sp. HY329]UXN10972.1 hypothetical protein N5852_14040 [Bartonella sp. HY328]
MGDDQDAAFLLVIPADGKVIISSKNDGADCLRQMVFNKTLPHVFFCKGVKRSLSSLIKTLQMTFFNREIIAKPIFTDISSQDILTSEAGLYLHHSNLYRSSIDLSS